MAAAILAASEGGILPPVVIMKYHFLKRSRDAALTGSRDGRRHMPALIAVLFLFAVSAFADRPSNRTQSFDSAWKFYKGDLPGAEQPAFDDRVIEGAADGSVGLIVTAVAGVQSRVFAAQNVLRYLQKTI